MTAIIRHPLTRLYHCKDGSWVNDSKLAQRFADIPTAIKFCFVKDFEAYQIMKQGPESETSVIIEKRPGKPFRAPISRAHLFAETTISKKHRASSGR